MSAARPPLSGPRILAIMREYLPPDFTDNHLEYILWNETGYPGFWHGEPEDSLRHQIAVVACRELHCECSYWDGNKQLMEYGR